MELIIKGTQKEIADLVLTLQGQRSLHTVIAASNELDIRAAAQAICDIQPEVLERLEKKCSGFGAQVYSQD